MVVFPRYSHHRHTGRLRPHYETSYALLLFVVLALGMLLASVTWSARADTRTTLCAEGGNDNCPDNTYTVSAVVPAARPTRAPVITNPSTGQSFGANPVKVEGTCEDKTIVKIFKNGILAGSVVCQGGRFSLPIDLVIGRNDLTAVSYNITDQPGPTSNTVTVTLTIPPGGFGFSNELILQSPTFFRGIVPGQEVVWPVELIGGLAPYAVSIDWGDGTVELVTRPAAGPFTFRHTYKKAGNFLGSYPLIIRATDSAGHTAYLQLVTIVNDATGTTATAATKQPLNKLIVIWPLWVILLLMVISFWLGEKREKRIMQRQLAALA